MTPTKPVVMSAAVQKLYASYAAFVQKGKHVLHRVAPPEIVDTPTDYKKKESGGILGMMQKIREELTADMTESETEEKFSAEDYVRLMKQAKETRATTLKEMENLNLYGVQLATECDFLMRNFEARHEGRVGEESGLEDAKSMITDQAPPSVGEIKAGFDAEKGDEDVEEHFPTDENGHTEHIH